MSECVYLHLDADGRKLYVGRSGRGRRRAAEHQAQSVFWPLVASTLWIHTNDPSDPWLTESMESLLIHYYKPKYNQRRETGNHLTAAMHLVKSKQMQRLPNTKTLMGWLEKQPAYRDWVKDGNDYVLIARLLNIATPS